MKRRCQTLLELIFCQHLIIAGKTMTFFGACVVGRRVKLRGVAKHYLSSYFCQYLINAGKTMKNFGACVVARRVNLRGIAKHYLSS